MMLLLFSCNDGPNLVLQELKKENGSQKSQTIAYRLEGDTVVFYFDVTEYNFYHKTFDGKHCFHDFWGDYMDLQHLVYGKFIFDKDEVDIETVHLLGDFNFWTEPGWKMDKVRDGYYQLKVHKKDLNNKYGAEFTFLINNTFVVFSDIAENAIHALPFSVLVLELPNVVDRPELGYKLSDSTVTFYFDKDDYVSTTDKDNGIKAFLDTMNIETVDIAGEFNAWEREPMFRQPDGTYTFTKPLSAIQNTEFKFRVNGENWVEPPFYVSNAIGTPYHFRFYNSKNFLFRSERELVQQGYYKEGRNVVFRCDLNKFTDIIPLEWSHVYVTNIYVKTVCLVGDISDWKVGNMEMEEVAEGVYEYAIPIEQFEVGKSYEFLFMINGMFFVKVPTKTANITKGYLWKDRGMFSFSLTLDDQSFSQVN
ncbi:hypothetical protein V6R21_31310 [Limibacter armeniacum]|uniref:hypothetical protein n=1 Tax=Limibacter armeniacum TaxID=466084 RepID=UPI002FE51EE8